MFNPSTIARKRGAILSIKGSRNSEYIHTSPPLHYCFHRPAPLDFSAAPVPDWQEFGFWRARLTLRGRGRTGLRCHSLQPDSVRPGRGWQQAIFAGFLSEPDRRGQPPGWPHRRNSFPLCTAIVQLARKLRRFNAESQRPAETRRDFIFSAFLRVPLRLCVKPSLVGHPTSKPENRFRAEKPRESGLDKRD
jgi:hypothetical protein